jgi:hypothetical protein
LDVVDTDAARWPVVERRRIAAQRHIGASSDYARRNETPKDDIERIAATFQRINAARIYSRAMRNLLVF